MTFLFVIPTLIEIFSSGGMTIFTQRILIGKITVLAIFLLISYFLIILKRKYQRLEQRDTPSTKS
jgi:hypothetical protein